MDTGFAALIRAVDHLRSRRSFARVFAGITLGGALTAARRDGTRVTAKKRGTGCPPCQHRRKKAKTCKPKTKANGASCLGDGKCYFGTCIPRPKCLSAGSVCEGTSIGCCSALCARTCGVGSEGNDCLENTDCAPGLTCIGYRCRPPRLKAP